MFINAARGDNNVRAITGMTECPKEPSSGPRNFDPRSSDEDDPRSGTTFLNLHITPTAGLWATTYLTYISTTTRGRGRLLVKVTNS
ncbi:hypothetical protein TNCV_2008411 [Trichonephila clavipes]|nr:hypothetical protein TNCV_2008411 [Trichonephila clavipes]